MNFNFRHIPIVAAKQTQKTKPTEPNLTLQNPTWRLALVLIFFLLLPAPPSPPFGRSHRLGLPMVVCVECLPADKPWDVVSVTRQSSGSGLAPRGPVCACTRVCWCHRIFTYIHTRPADRNVTESGVEPAICWLKDCGGTTKPLIYKVSCDEWY